MERGETLFYRFHKFLIKPETFPNYFGNKKQERYQTSLFLKKLETEMGNGNVTKQALKCLEEVLLIV